MTDQEMTQQMVEKMDEWAKRIADKTFMKECEHTPPAVACLAAIYFIKEMVKRSDVVTPAAILKILEGKLYEDDDVGAVPPCGAN